MFYISGGKVFSLFLSMLAAPRPFAPFPHRKQQPCSLTLYRFHHCMHIASCIFSFSCCYWFTFSFKLILHLPVSVPNVCLISVCISPLFVCFNLQLGLHTKSGRIIIVTNDSSTGSFEDWHFPFSLILLNCPPYCSDFPLTSSSKTKNKQKAQN